MRTEKGRKDDTGKHRWSLFPVGTLAEIVAVLEFGANRYGPDNWCRVPDLRTRYYDALMRHIDKWWQGARIDPDDGRHHLAHAACCIVFLIANDFMGYDGVTKPLKKLIKGGK